MIDVEDVLSYMWSKRLESLISFLFVFFFIYLFSLVGCSIPVGDISVYGNCHELNGLTSDSVYEGVFKSLEKANKVGKTDVFTRTNTNTTIILYQNVTCPEVKPTVCPVVPACPVCESNAVTLPQVCPTCPPCGGLDEVVSKELLNIKPGENGNGAISMGFFMCKTKVLDLLGLKKSKFNEAPSKVDYYSIATGGKSVEDEEYCFKDLGGYFILNRTPDLNNRSRWGWNDDNCLKSWVRINHL